VHGVYGHDGYILNAWNNGTDVVSLPSRASSYSHPQRTTTVWQLNTTDQRALRGPAGQTQRNATALTSSTPPTQAAQVLTVNARTLITASVFLLNWGAAPTSTKETVQVQDAVGTHTYVASNFNNRSGA